MGKLIYLLNVSLDGFVETPERSTAWTSVDDELHTWFNDQMGSQSALLYGRRIYEVMAAYWQTAESDPNATEPMLEFARIWNPLPKFVFSSSLDRVEHNSRLVRGDVGEVLGAVRDEFQGDIGVAGPNLASQFIERGLVDEYRMVIHPVVLGAGTPFFPALDEPLRLRQVSERRFASGVAYRGYAPA